MEKSITKERIVGLYKTLKPLVRKDNLLYTIEIDPLESVALTWSPKIDQEVTNIEEYTRIPFFSYSYPLFWKPGINEVFVEIQDNQEIIKECSWFEVLDRGMDNVHGRGRYGEAIFYKEKQKKVNEDLLKGISITLSIKDTGVTLDCQTKFSDEHFKNGIMEDAMIDFFKLSKIAIEKSILELEERKLKISGDIKNG